MKVRYIILLAQTGFLVSCSKVVPAGFWSQYEKQSIVDRVSDQGPYGGHTAIFWEFPDSSKPADGVAVRFAQWNGWQLLDSSFVSRAQTDTWIYNDKPVFPLTGSGFSGSISNNTQVRHFPRRIVGPINVYRFKTNWAAIAPGSDEATFENGFITVDSSKRRMAVYHLWGE